MHIIPSSIAFCERAYSKPNAIKSPLATFTNWTLWILWYEYLHAGESWKKWTRGQYFSYGTTRKIWEFLVWNKKCKKFKLLCVYFGKNKIFLIFNLVSKIKIFSTHHLKNSYFMLSVTFKTKQNKTKRQRVTWNKGRPTKWRSNAHNRATYHKHHLK